MAVGALSIWVHHLQKIQFHESFKCGHGSDRGYSAVTVGAGIQWEELYWQAYQRKMILAGGGCSSVGAAGGYPQVGGQSFLSLLIGLSADNVLEYEVVTADACQNTDLFWASPGCLDFAPHNFSTPNTTTFQGLLTLFTRLNPSLSDARWSGYFFSTSQSLTLTFLLPNRNVSYASTTLAPLLLYARENNIRIDGSLETYASYWDWHLQFQCGGQESCLGLNNLGVSDVFATRLIPRSLFNHEQDLLPKAMMRVMTELQVPATYAILGGGKVREPQDSAVNPAYRDGLWLLVSPLTWRDNATVAEMRAAANLVSQANKLFIDLTPGSGTYVNEADYNEPNWQQSFFGKNYPRLYHIKRRVDPINLFTCHHCVGIKRRSCQFQSRSAGGWKVMYAWNGEDPCGDGDAALWPGITFSSPNDDGYRVVTELELFQVSIIGTFPIGVTNLLDLRKLWGLAWQQTHRTDSSSNRTAGEPCNPVMLLPKNSFMKRIGPYCLDRACHERKGIPAR
ncbi:hypothetical protein SELMODRAFT_421442 [Selaginella moellendorffii]|uniref:FAD-binding PCMH-type domain-containing protein n=1 Tax=Selaginella moellendorffii TaxID=88036 RepID=D8SFA5_SELML|nr:hypothetical protein SELMODRAFT_421442 [Selaginella moellendorffii]